MQFNLGNLFGGGGDKPPPGKTVSLKEAGIVPDVLAEEGALLDERLQERLQEEGLMLRDSNDDMTSGAVLSRIVGSEDDANDDGRHAEERVPVLLLPIKLGLHCLPQG